MGHHMNWNYIPLRLTRIRSDLAWSRDWFDVNCFKISMKEKLSAANGFKFCMDFGTFNRDSKVASQSDQADTKYKEIEKHLSFSWFVRRSKEGQITWYWSLKSDNLTVLYQEQKHSRLNRFQGASEIEQQIQLDETTILSTVTMMWIL